MFIYGQIFFFSGSALAPTQAVGVPPQITRSFCLHTNNNFSKKEIISEIIEQTSSNTDFNRREIDKLYSLSVKYRENKLNKDEVIAKINNLRGGSFVDLAKAMAIFAAIIILQTTNPSAGFQTVPLHLQTVPPHLQWLYGDNSKTRQFGYGKACANRNFKVPKAVKNAGSVKKSSSGSWDYNDIRKQLDTQSSKKLITIQGGNGEIYNLKNPYRKSTDELSFDLADQIYESIRESNTDISDISKNLGFKERNIENVKNHVFIQKHELDQYVCMGEKSEYKRFDPYIKQALAWKRLQSGNHSKEDITWIKHECAERHHELKYNSGYYAAHTRAQSRFDGDPWENN